VSSAFGILTRFQITIGTSVTEMLTLVFIKNWFKVGFFVDETNNYICMGALQKVNHRKSQPTEIVEKVNHRKSQLLRKQY
jgi:hypothetical protein